LMKARARQAHLCIGPCAVLDIADAFELPSCEALEMEPQQVSLVRNLVLDLGLGDRLVANVAPRVVAITGDYVVGTNNGQFARFDAASDVGAKCAFRRRGSCHGRR
jgi:hypothetical protein